MPSLFNSRLNAPIILAAVLGFAVSNVAAHGYVDTVTIDGKTYPGWRPFVDPYSDPVPQRIVRKVASDSPVLNPHDPSIACNVDGEQGAGLVADVNGGSKVTFTWNTWPTDHHGPVTTWMASCGGDCTTFDASNAEFFKIDQEGYLGPPPAQNWATDKLIQDNFSWTVTIPKTIKDGEYLVRHEILAMHSVGQPQFYPSCTQVRVNNGGSSAPASTEVVKATDIYDSATFPDIWDGVKSFNIAGPSLAKMVTGGGSSSGNAPAAPAAPTSTAKHSTSTSSPSPGKSPAPKRCRTKKNSNQSLHARHARSAAKRILRHERKSGSWLF